MLTFLHFLKSVYYFVFRPQTSGVRCLIKSDDRILLIKHSYIPKIWSLPGGGFNKIETKEHAIRREIKEELGIDLIDLHYLGSYFSELEYKKDTIHMFVAEMVGDIKLNAEISEYKWFDKDQIPSNNSRVLRETLKRL